MAHTMKEVSSKEARDNLAKILNQVAYSGKRYTLTRHGNGVAVLISLEEWQSVKKLLEQLEEEQDLHDAEKAFLRAKKEGTISHAALKRKLGL